MLTWSPTGDKGRIGDDDSEGCSSSQEEEEEEEAVFFPACPIEEIEKIVCGQGPTRMDLVLKEGMVST